MPQSTNFFSFYNQLLWLDTVASQSFKVYIVLTQPVYVDFITT